jgi:hypothetical protein
VDIPISGWRHIVAKEIDIKLRLGTKIEAEEEAKLDPAKRGILTNYRPEPEVEGQWLYPGITECPWCGNLGHSILDTDVYRWYTCGRCGRSFRA